MVRQCVDCRLSDKELKFRVQPLTEREFPERPWEEVALDITGPVQSSERKFIHLTIDCYVLKIA